MCITDHWKEAGKEVEDAFDGKKIALIKGVEIDGVQGVTAKDGTKKKFASDVIGLYLKRGGIVEQDYHLSLKGLGENDAYLIICHPFWSGDTVERLSELNHFQAIEIYNHVAMDINYRGYSVELWDALLAKGIGIWGIAADDAHINDAYPYYDGAWIVVKSRECRAPEIIRSLRRGSFYSSQGPEIYEIDLENDTLIIRCSPVRKVVIYGDGKSRAIVLDPGNRAMAKWKLSLSDIIRECTKYFRIELKDENGKTAWTNPFFKK